MAGNNSLAYGAQIVIDLLSVQQNDLDPLRWQVLCNVQHQQLKHREDEVEELIAAMAPGANMPTLSVEAQRIGTIHRSDELSERRD